MLTLLAFFVVVGVIIFVHELGHFLAARSVGIRVETFSLGYPPKMISRRRGETEYSVGWIPFGGYVKMAGMIDESLQGESSLTGAPWEFQSKNTWQKLWVISAGVIMNMVLAVVLYTGITAIKGYPEASEAAMIGAVTPGWPAEQAGLLPGDRIVSIDGTPIENWDDVLREIRPRAGVELELAYARGAELHSVRLTPEGYQLEGDDEGEGQPRGLVGIDPEIYFRPATPGEVLTSGVRSTATVIVMAANNVWKLVTLEVSIRELGGPLLIAKMSGASAKRGLAYFLGFIALISINIGFLNLLPIPALDGGHLIIVAAEGIAGRALPTRAKLAVQQVGVFLLLALMVLVIVNDVQRVVDFSWLGRIF